MIMPLSLDVVVACVKCLLTFVVRLLLGVLERLVQAVVGNRRVLEGVVRIDRRCCWTCRRYVRWRW